MNEEHFSLYVTVIVIRHEHSYQIKVRATRRDKSRKGNLETQATLSTKHNTKINNNKNTTQKNKMISNTDHQKKTRVNIGARVR
jgi:hypothetical protein